MASESSQMANDDFWVFVDEITWPEMLDKRVRKEFDSYAIVVLSENLNE